MKHTNLWNKMIVYTVLLSVLLAGCGNAAETTTTEKHTETEAKVKEVPQESVSEEEAIQYHYNYKINKVLSQFSEHLSEEEVAVGNEIIAAVHEGRKKINTRSLKYEGIIRAWYAALLSNPIVNLAGIDVDNKKLTYEKSGKKHREYVKLWENEVEEILNSNIKTSYNDLLKAAAIERFIAITTKYEYAESEDLEETGTSEDETNALTVIMDHKGICNGYARAMAYLLNEVGVTVYITANGGHEWNMIKIDGSWYHIDATFDSEEGLTEAEYSWTNFGMSDEKRSDTLEFMGGDYKKWWIPYAGDEKTIFKAPKCRKELDTSNLSQQLADS